MASLNYNHAYICVFLFVQPLLYRHNSSVSCIYHSAGARLPLVSTLSNPKHYNIDIAALMKFKILYWKLNFIIIVVSKSSNERTVSSIFQIESPFMITSTPPEVLLLHPQKFCSYTPRSFAPASTIALED